jgi:hypothetical protein
MLFDLLKASDANKEMIKTMKAVLDKWSVQSWHVAMLAYSNSEPLWLWW